MSANILSKLLFKTSPRLVCTHYYGDTRYRLCDVCFASSLSSADFSAVLNVLTLVGWMRGEDVSTDVFSNQI